MRIQREIPMNEIEGGARAGNLRQLVLARTREKGYACNCIRCREVVLREPEAMSKDDSLEYKEQRYRASDGEEVFGSYEFARSGVISAFVRMRMPSAFAHRPEMHRSAVVRELRVYGRTVRVGHRETSAWQHKGLGADLMRRMEKIAGEDYDTRRLLVTSAVGTRNYYRKLGYERVGPYMGLNLSQGKLRRIMLLHNRN